MIFVLQQVLLWLWCGYTEPPVPAAGRAYARHGHAVRLRCACRDAHSACQLIKRVDCLDYSCAQLPVCSKRIRCWACRCRLVIGQSVDCIACVWVGECEAKANEMIIPSSVFRKFTYSWIAMICAHVICYVSRWHKLAAVVQSAMCRFLLVLTFCVLTTLFHRRCWQLFDLPYYRNYWSLLRWRWL